MCPHSPSKRYDYDQNSLAMTGISHDFFLQINCHLVDSVTILVFNNKKKLYYYKSIFFWFMSVNCCCLYLLLCIYSLILAGSINLWNHLLCRFQNPVNILRTLNWTVPYVCLCQLLVLIGKPILMLISLFSWGVSFQHVEILQHYVSLCQTLIDIWWSNIQMPHLQTNHHARIAVQLRGQFPACQDTATLCGFFRGRSHLPSDL